jgi:excisionase family DNA binding protein
MRVPLAYDVRAINEQTGWSKSFTYRLIETGQLPAVRVGRSVRVLHTDLVKFLEAHRVGGDTDAE